MNEVMVELDEEKNKSLKSLTQVVYVLYALHFFYFVTAIVGVIINYVKKEEVAGTWLESHFKWQIRTFWFGLLWAVLGGVFLSRSSAYLSPSPSGLPTFAGCCIASSKAGSISMTTSQCRFNPC